MDAAIKIVDARDAAMLTEDALVNFFSVLRTQHAGIKNFKETTKEERFKLLVDTRLFLTCGTRCRRS